MYLIANMLIIIIGLLLYNHYYFLLYTWLQSSPDEHENLSSKHQLKGNSSTYFNAIFL